MKELSFKLLTRSKVTAATVLETHDLFTFFSSE